MLRILQDFAIQDEDGLDLGFGEEIAAAPQQQPASSDPGNNAGGGGDAAAFAPVPVQEPPTKETAGADPARAVLSRLNGSSAAASAVPSSAPPLPGAKQGLCIALPRADAAPQPPATQPMGPPPALGSHPPVGELLLIPVTESLGDSFNSAGQSEEGVRADASQLAEEARAGAALPPTELQCAVLPAKQQAEPLSESLLLAACSHASSHAASSGLRGSEMETDEGGHPPEHSVTEAQPVVGTGMPAAVVAVEAAPASAAEAPAPVTACWGSAVVDMSQQPLPDTQELDMGEAQLAAVPEPKLRGCSESSGEAEGSKGGLADGCLQAQLALDTHEGAGQEAGEDSAADQPMHAADDAEVALEPSATSLTLAGPAPEPPAARMPLPAAPQPAAIQPVAPLPPTELPQTTPAQAKAPAAEGAGAVPRPPPPAAPPKVLPPPLLAVTPMPAPSQPKFGAAAHQPKQLTRFAAGAGAGPGAQAVPGAKAGGALFGLPAVTPAAPAAAPAPKLPRQVARDAAQATGSGVTQAAARALLLSQAPVMAPLTILSTPCPAPAAAALGLGGAGARPAAHTPAPFTPGAMPPPVQPLPPFLALSSRAPAAPAAATKQLAATPVPAGPDPPAPGPPPPADPCDDPLLSLDFSLGKLEGHERRMESSAALCVSVVGTALQQEMAAEKVQGWWYVCVWGGGITRCGCCARMRHHSCTLPA